MTEIGVALRMGLCIYVFVLNNDGYDVERALHGEKAKYNDIQAYDHQFILPMMAGKSCKVSVWLVAKESDWAMASVDDCISDTLREPSG